MASPSDEGAATDGVGSVKTRLITVAVFLPIVAAAAWLGHPWFTVLLAAALGGGAYEFGRLGLRLKHEVRPVLCAVPAALLALDAGFTAGQYRDLLVALTLICWAVWYVLHAHSPTRSEAFAVSIVASLYVGYLGSHLVSLRQLADGLSWLALAVVTVWISDTGAYLVGRTWGRRPLAPHLSPKKTWEGVAGGLVTGIVGGLVVALAGGLAPIHGIAVGTLAGVICPAGDLIISMLKRQAQVKDSGALFPGHGGLLDRLDTLLFAAPLTFYYATLVAGAI